MAMLSSKDDYIAELVGKKLDGGMTVLDWAKRFKDLHIAKKKEGERRSTLLDERAKILNSLEKCDENLRKIESEIESCKYYLLKSAVE